MKRSMEPRYRPVRIKRRRSAFPWVSLLVGLGLGLALIGLGVVFVVSFWPSGRGDVRAHRPTPSGWLDVKSTEGRFRIFMPGSPKIVDSVVHTKLGSLQIKAYDFDLGDHFSSFSVFYGDLDPSGLGKVSPEQWIDAVRDIYIVRSKATLLDEKALSFQGQFGKETRYEIAGHGKVVRRMFAVNRRIYTVNFAAKELDSQEDVMARFFDSFEILP